MRRRSVPEWVGKTPDAAIPARVPSLLPHEKGRGAKVSAQRLEEIQRYCARRVMDGVPQSEIRKELGASRSRVSRWTLAGLSRFGEPEDQRHVRTGDKSLTQMMWHRIDVRGPDECWPWIGAIKPNGYGSLNFRGTPYNAHRLVFETLAASVPDGMVLDHKCQNKACVNPRHLQVVSQSANVLLGLSRRKFG